MATASLQTGKQVLRITVQGATEDELQLGLEAARQVFAKARVSARRAARAYFDREAPHPRNSDGHEISDLWTDADVAAAAACCERWKKKDRPSSAKLELVRPDPGIARAVRTLYVMVSGAPDALYVVFMLGDDKVMRTHETATTVGSRGEMRALASQCAALKGVATDRIRIMG